MRDAENNIPQPDQHPSGAMSADAPGSSASEVWLTASELAEHLGVSKRTVERMALPHVYMGRIPMYSRRVVDEYLLARMIYPTTPAPTATTSTQPRSRRSSGRRRKAVEPDRVARRKALKKLMFS